MAFTGYEERASKLFFCMAERAGEHGVIWLPLVLFTFPNCLYLFVFNDIDFSADEQFLG